jgi:hypothetical protein
VSTRGGDQASSPIMLLLFSHSRDLLCQFLEGIDAWESCPSSTLDGAGDWRRLLSKRPSRVDTHAMAGSICLKRLIQSRLRR